MSFYDSTFEGVDVPLDGQHFERCKFIKCHLIYAGGRPPSLVSNEFRECFWDFVDAAKNTMMFVAALDHGGASELVDHMLGRRLVRASEEATHVSPRIEEGATRGN